MLNPRWLQTFAALLKAGNFTRAAEALQLTQAAVSQHLRHLEDALGLLVIRHPRRIELTPAGQALLDYCVEIDICDQRLQARLSGSEAEMGEISFITPGSIGLAIYPMLLRLQREHPGWSVRHSFAPDPDVRKGVLENRYELGLVTVKPDDPRFKASYFAEEALELVAPAQVPVHEWADLERLGFIDHPDGQAMANRLLSRRFPGNPGIKKIRRSGFSNQVGLILEPVASGLGFTVIPRYARQAFARPDTIKVVECDTPTVDTLWLLHRAEWELSKRATRAIDYLRLQLAVKSQAALM